MSHRRIALGVASTGIALAFVVLVRLFKRGNKKTKPDVNVARKNTAASRQATRSPTGQVNIGWLAWRGMEAHKAPVAQDIAVSIGSYRSVVWVALQGQQHGCVARDTVQ